jgi:hypothetical protein
MTVMKNTISIPTNAQYYFDVVLLQGILQHVSVTLCDLQGGIKKGYNYKSVRTIPPLNVLLLENGVLLHCTF